MEPQVTAHGNKKGAKAKPREHNKSSVLNNTTKRLRELSKNRAKSLKSEKAGASAGQGTGPQNTSGTCRGNERPGSPTWYIIIIGKPLTHSLTHSLTHCVETNR